jgi:hypothetical protein
MEVVETNKFLGVATEAFVPNRHFKGQTFEPVEIYSEALASGLTVLETACHGRWSNVANVDGGAFWIVLGADGADIVLPYERVGQDFLGLATPENRSAMNWVFKRSSQQAVELLQTHVDTVAELRARTSRRVDFPDPPKRGILMRPRHVLLEPD